MKSIFSVAYLPLFLAAAMLGGCAPVESFLRSDLPADALEIAATDVDSHPIGIEASASWMFDTTLGARQDEVLWLRAWYDESNPTLIWAQATGPNENPEPRTDTIVVVSGDGLALEIPVRQQALEVSFSVTPRTLEPFGARDTGTQTLTVASTLTWEYTTVGESEWLVLTRGTETGTNGTIVVEVRPTRDLDMRRDTIVVRPVNEAFREGYSDSIAVRQEGIDLLIEAGEAMNPETFEIDIPAAGGEITLWVYSRSPWTISSDAPAERVTLDADGGAADIETGIPVLMTAAPNTSTEQLKFRLTLTSAGQTYEYICTQQGDPTLNQQLREEGI
jgi:hypothetical protein